MSSACGFLSKYYGQNLRFTRRDASPLELWDSDSTFQVRFTMEKRHTMERTRSSKPNRAHNGEMPFLLDSACFMLFDEGLPFLELAPHFGWFYRETTRKTTITLGSPKKIKIKLPSSFCPLPTRSGRATASPGPHQKPPRWPQDVASSSQETKTCGK